MEFARNVHVSINTFHSIGVKMSKSKKTASEMSEMNL